MSSITRIKIPIPFPIASVNIYFIEDSIPTLIDAGLNSEEGLSVVKKALWEKGIRLSDIRRVLLTHGHLDHVGLAGKIQESGGAEVFIHSWDRGKCIHNGRIYSEEKKPFFFRFFREGGASNEMAEGIFSEMNARFGSYYPADFTVQDLEANETIFFDDFGLEVIHCPGHTRGSVCFLDRENKRFFSGDHLLENITSNPVVELETRGNGTGFKSLLCYLTSLCFTENLDIKEVLPGHGPSFYQHRKRINQIKKHHRERGEEIRCVLKDFPDGINLFAITMILFPGIKGGDIFLGMSEIVGHLEILEENGFVTSRMVGDQRIYQSGN